MVIFMAYAVHFAIYFPLKTGKVVGWLLVPLGTHPSATWAIQWHWLPPCPTGNAAFTNQFLVKDPVKQSLPLSA